MKIMKKIIVGCLSLYLMSSINYAASYEMHTVQEGDTYWNISRSHNVNTNQLMEINDANSPKLIPGDLIKIQPISQSISIVVNGSKLQPDVLPYIENSRTFVPIRFVSEALDAQVSWDQSTKTATIKKESKTIKLPIGSSVAYVNGAPYSLDAPIQIYNSRTFVPLRFITELFGCTVNWNQEEYKVSIHHNAIQAASFKTPTYTSDELEWLARIVHAEAEGEPFEGKLAVANVVLNRKESNEFPNTIYGVIFDPGQFTPASNGKINNSPSEESRLAAKAALDGSNNVPYALFFFNPNKSTSTFFTNRTYLQTIGGHEFYL